MKTSARALVFALALAATAVAGAIESGHASAAVPIVDGEDVTFDLSGYVRSLSGVEHIPYDVLDLFPQDIGLGAAILRFEWGLNLGENVTIDIHDRFFWQSTSVDLGLTAGGIGLGVSTAPGRHLDLRSVILEEEGLLLEHDVDRLALHLYLEQADLTLGRQAITWGRANLFPVADLWTQFSPFDLDTSQKRGTDALRVLTAPGERVELELVVADRGEPAADAPDDFAHFFLDFGVSANLFLEFGDAFVAFGKLFDSLMLMGGVAADLSKVSVRLDAVLPFDLTDEEVALPRITAGLDYIYEDLYLTVEYHYNGAGVSDADKYVGHYQSDTITRGETYLVGRHYAGTAVSYIPIELITVTLGVISNLQDPSVILTPTVDYEVSSDVNLSLGSYVGFGERPEIGLVPVLHSEFGSFGNLYYMQAAAFW